MKATRKTPEGHEIPIPKRSAVFAALKKAANPKPKSRGRRRRAK